MLLIYLGGSDAICFQREERERERKKTIILRLGMPFSPKSPLEILKMTFTGFEGEGEGKGGLMRFGRKKRKEENKKSVASFCRLTTVNLCNIIFYPRCKKGRAYSPNCKKCTV